ncbi:hypothetical protein Pmar_PMAR019560 [Perkinsus marinus ATCC 50983]|uniref:TLDc domain-containing protein n=1 Tax=Perkinsus marinus (strain ATCC 50983 / TXsc) TaxID=423536 RepID=C5LGF7_PERM5|nr:hypothetical protein Pmar_PMAR019560 [Perkinsus marinus ATCC 50983]EER04143.1 hypothetical protein Pmar_PMAR019560 [Perkinsus marinus ATCC 50983]|eukprot:XP_002772327.1 hypothetical protein Pmar_PMAR019560 [Perkinsus marinus ATCC 50983]
MRRQVPGNAKSFTILRLFRLLRLVLALRKAGRSRKKRKGQNGADTALQFSSRVDKVVDILRDVYEVKGLSGPMRERLNWATEIIQTNNLYTISVSAGKGGSSADEDEEDELGPIRQEINEWLTLGSASAKTSTKPGGITSGEIVLKKATDNAAVEDDTAKVPPSTRTRELLKNILDGVAMDNELTDMTGIQRFDMDPATSRVVAYLSRSATSWGFNVFTLRFLLGHPESLPDPGASDAAYAPEIDPMLKNPAEVLALSSPVQNQRKGVFAFMQPRVRRAATRGAGGQFASTVRLTSLGEDVFNGTLYRSYNSQAAFGVYDDHDLPRLPVLACSGMYFLSVVSAFGSEYGQIEPHQAGQSEDSLKGQPVVPSDPGRESTSL